MYKILSSYSDATMNIFTAEIYNVTNDIMTANDKEDWQNSRTSFIINNFLTLIQQVRGCQVLIMATLQIIDNKFRTSLIKQMFVNYL